MRQCCHVKANGQNERFITLLQAKQTSFCFPWRSHVYLHSSEATVEEAGVQAGSFLFLTPTQPLKLGEDTLEACCSLFWSLELSCFFSPTLALWIFIMQDYYQTVVVSEEFRLEGFCGYRYLPQYIYPRHLGETDFSHTVRHKWCPDTPSSYPFLSAS